MQRVQTGSPQSPLAHRRAGFGGASKPNIPDRPLILLQDKRPAHGAVHFGTDRCANLGIVVWPLPSRSPDFSRFAADYPHIAVLGLAVDSGNAADVRRAASQFGIDYPWRLPIEVWLSSTTSLHFQPPLSSNRMAPLDTFKSAA